MTPGLAILAIAGAIAVGAASPGPSFVMVMRTALARSRCDGVDRLGAAALPRQLCSVLHAAHGPLPRRHPLIVGNRVGVARIAVETVSHRPDPVALLDQVCGSFGWPAPYHQSGPAHRRSPG